jgi:hypothetical protein
MFWQWSYTIFLILSMLLPSGILKSICLNQGPVSNSNIYEGHINGGCKKRTIRFCGPKNSKMWPIITKASLFWWFLWHCGSHNNIRRPTCGPRVWDPWSKWMHFLTIFSVTRTCSESTNTNGTYFQNRAYPSTFDTVGSCQLTVDKANDNVCQLR